MIILKKILVAILFSVFFLNVGATQSYAQEPPSIFLNDHYVQSDKISIVKNNITYLPFRTLFESFLFTVEYFPQYQSALVWNNKGNFKIEFKINSTKVQISSTLVTGNTITKNISNSPILVNGSVYVPIRAFGELLGANVRYDKLTNQVLIHYSSDETNKLIYPQIGNVTSSDLEEVVITPSVPTAQQIFKDSSESIGYVQVLNRRGEVICTGSGVELSNGVFITNSHVALCAEDESVFLKVHLNGQVYSNGEGWYVFNDQVNDLFAVALGKNIDQTGKATEGPSVGFNLVDRKMEIGDKVYAIGSPLGLENTLSDGIISSVRTIDNKTLIQHNADITHGSSGGALLDEYGYLIGITSSGVEGTSLNFAIPISYIKKKLDELGIKYS